MKVALRLVALVSLFVFSTSLSAQTEQVNLAIIGEINVTLNANCQDSLLLEEVVAGEFDVDGNGITPADTEFSIIVEDNDQSNGPIIDGCGTYSFRVEASANVTGFATGWGVVNAEDKTSPVFTSTPAAPAGPLYCEAIDGITVSNLPAGVSRCYRVFTATGNIIANSIDPALRDRIIAGGGFPVATDNCASELEICVNDLIEQDPNDPDCGNETLRRTFTVTDGGCPSVSGEMNAPGLTSYTITFTRPQLADIVLSEIPEIVEFACGDLDDLGLAFGDVPAPRVQDLPFFNGPDGTTIPVGVGIDGSFCNIGVTYEDSPLITTCDLAYKVIRTFTLIDWCNSSTVETYVQTIKVGDFSAPDFVAPTQDLDFDGVPDVGGLQFLTNAGNVCGAYIRLDQSTIELTDACSANLTLSASIYPNGDLGAVPFGPYDVDLEDLTADVSGLLPTGTHLLRYSYADDCDNAGFSDVDITIVDGTNPIAICEDGLNVSLTAGVGADGVSSLGLAVITPEMIDRNSSDDCSDVSLAVGRMQQNADGTYSLVPGTSYAERVDLSCEDIGTVVLGLEVTDALDNRNVCWLNVLVEDKQDPICLAPAPINLDCNQFASLGFPADINEVSATEINAAFGVPFAQDNCGTTITSTISGNLDACGEGQFQRDFVVVDPSGNDQTCSQTITIRGVYDYTISFPGDTDAFCVDAPEVTDVEVVEGACDLITTDVSIDTFQSQSDACYLLRINHLVINFCEYNTLGEPYLIRRDADGDGDFNERVFVHLIPGDASTQEDDAAILDNDGIRTNNNDILFPFIPVDDGDDNDGSDDQNDNDNEGGQAPDGVGFAYAQDNSRGAFLYHQFISVFDEVAPTLTATIPAECFGAQSLNCTGEVSLTFSTSDVCTPQEQLDVRIELDEDYAAGSFSRDRFLLPTEFTQDGVGNYTISLANVPVGEHAVRVRVTDNCGNPNAQIINFCVTDDKAPTPICIGQLTVTLMPNGDGTGNAAVWASDFIASDVEDCSGEVTYSIYTEREATLPGFTPEPGVNGIILDCESDATTPVRVYAFDPTGLFDYCSVFVLVQRADNACVVEETGAIGGGILSESGLVFANVAIGLDGSEIADSTETDDNGRFLFPRLAVGDDYTINPDLDIYINHSQGVSTFDLVLITQHILGTEPLTSPFQMLAADANNDREVTVQDLIAIRRLILGYDDAFPNNTGYRFIDENFIFPISNNPWATSFPEVVNINNLSGNVFDADFIGLMVGDVNGDGLDNLLNGGAGQPRFGAKDIIVEDLYLRAGETHTVTILPGEASSLKGLQGTITAAPELSITNVEAGQLGAAGINTAYLERGQLPFSFAEAAGLNEEQPLLNLQVVANRDVLLSEVLSLTDNRVTAEGYAQNDARVNLNLAFTSSVQTDVSSSMSNYPNPMDAQTTISFQLPQSGTGSLTVRDINGRTVFDQPLSVRAGQNQVILQRASLPRAGVYTYTVSARGTTMTRKLIVR